VDVDVKVITTEDAVPLSGSLSCFAAAAADAAADSSAVTEMAAATIAACGSSYCSSAAADGAAMDAEILSANFFYHLPFGQVVSIDCIWTVSNYGIASGTMPFFLLSASVFRSGTPSPCAASPPFPHAERTRRCPFSEQPLANSFSYFLLGSLAFLSFSRSCS